MNKRQCYIPLVSCSVDHSHLINSCNNTIIETTAISILSRFTLTFLSFCSIAHTVIIKRPPIRRTLANSRRALTLLSFVAKWCITAIDKTASKLSSRNGSVKLSQSKTYM